MAIVPVPFLIRAGLIGALASAGATAILQLNVQLKSRQWRRFRRKLAVFFLGYSLARLMLMEPFHEEPLPPVDAVDEYGNHLRRATFLGAYGITYAMNLGRRKNALGRNVDDRLLYRERSKQLCISLGIPDDELLDEIEDLAMNPDQERRDDVQIDILFRVKAVLTSAESDYFNFWVSYLETQKRLSRDMKEHPSKTQADEDFVDGAVWSFVDWVPFFVEKHWHPFLPKDMFGPLYTRGFMGKVPKSLVIEHEAPTDLGTRLDRFKELAEVRMNQLWDRLITEQG